MIRQLTLRDVGPTRALSFDLARRLNVLTGDNGLGKSFVLDTVWWVLTGAWAGEQAHPWRPRETLADWEERAEHPALQPGLSAAVEGAPSGITATVSGTYREADQTWDRDTSPTAVGPSVVLYARVDGQFAVWDALYAGGRLDGVSDRDLSLTEDEVWNGKVARDGKTGKTRTVIRGLIDDWVGWQQSRAPEFTALCRVLDALGTEDEPLVPGQPTRVRLDDRRDVPTLDSTYGSVPVTLASAGVRRTLALAYLLVWAWTEHRKAAKLTRASPSRDIVVLIDEPETHLHPSWQRVFLPSVMRALSLTAPNAAFQLITATHSPLVLASLETIFREEMDDLFVLKRDGTVIRAAETPFVKEGDAAAWLESGVFAADGGRSREAALAVAAAQHFLAERHSEARAGLGAFRGRLARLDELTDDSLLVGLDVPEEGDVAELARCLHAALAASLPGHDEFWVHWLMVYHPARGLRSGP